MPVFTFDSLDVVPAELRDQTKAVDGDDKKVTLNLVSAKALDQFRENNIGLVKERDTLKGQLDLYMPIVGDKPEDFVQRLKELESTAQRVKDGQLKETHDIEEATLRRTDEMRKDYEGRLQTVGKELAAWRDKAGSIENQYKTSLVASYLKDACVDAASGVEPTAISDIVRNGLDTFRMTDDGKIVPFEGDAPIYGADGSSPMSAKEWLSRLKEVKPFMFKGTQGGGAGGLTTDKKTLGRTHEQLKKMSAVDLLALANGDKVR